MSDEVEGSRLLAWVATPRAEDAWRFSLVVAAVYLALHVVLLAFHEPWRDEADAWLYAAAMEPATLRQLTSNAGTPALWYVMLAPFAKAGLPYGTLFVIHGVFAVLAATLFLRFAPFSRPLRVLFVFSFFMSYEYGLVARHYVLVALLLFGLAALQRQRLDRPLLYGLLLGLLFNVNAFGGALAGGIALGFAWDVFGARRPRPAAGLAVAAAFALCALWQIWPNPEGQLTGMSVANPVSLLEYAGWAFYPQAGSAPLAFVVVASVGGCVTLAATAWSVSRQRRVLVSLLVGGAGLVLVLLIGYAVSLRHAGMIQLLVVYCLWVSHGEEEAPPLPRWPRAQRHAVLLWGLSLVAALPPTVKTWGYTVLHQSSGAEAVGKFLRANDLDREEIAAHRPAKTLAVLPYLRRKTFYYPAYGEDGSHMWWDQAYVDAELVLPSQAFALAEAHYGDASFLFLVNGYMADPELHGCELLFENEGEIVRATDERFSLYRRKARR